PVNSVPVLRKHLKLCNQNRSDGGDCEIAGLDSVRAEIQRLAVDLVVQNVDRIASGANGPKLIGRRLNLHALSHQLRRRQKVAQRIDADRAADVCFAKRINADHLAVQVQQWTPGVAGLEQEIA